MDLILIAATSLAAAVLACIVAVNAGEKLLASHREKFLEQARVNLSDLFLFVEPRILYAANLVAIATLPLLLWLLSGWWLAAIVLAMVLAVLPRKAYRWLRQRRLNTLQAQLPDALMMLSGSIRAGLGFAPALESIVRDGRPPLTQELALVLREQHVGVKTDDALEHFAGRVPLPDARLFVSAVSISRAVGGNLAENLATLAETLRRRLVMEEKVRALTAQGRLQGIVMASLPVCIVAYLATMYPATMRPMFETWHGMAVIATGIVLEYVGYRVCMKIVTIDI